MTTIFLSGFSDTIHIMTNPQLHALKPDNPTLRQISQSIGRRELRTAAMQNTIEQLIRFVCGHNNKGRNHAHNLPMTVGLSAPQVGIMRRISIVDMGVGSKKYSDIHVLINPEIIKRSKSKATNREGCVNLPSVWGLIDRASAVTVTALDRFGTKLTLEAKGWPAILLQHEVDHLDGRLFIDYLPDPTKAHFLDKKNFKAYNKKTAADWPHNIDVSNLVRPLLESANNE